MLPPSPSTNRSLRGLAEAMINGKAMEATIGRQRLGATSQLRVGTRLEVGREGVGIRLDVGVEASRGAGEDETVVAAPLNPQQLDTCFTIVYK